MIFLYPLSSIFKTGIFSVPSPIAEICVFQATLLWNQCFLWVSKNLYSSQVKVPQSGLVFKVMCNLTYPIQRQYLILTLRESFSAVQLWTIITTTLYMSSYILLFMSILWPEYPSHFIYGKYMGQPASAQVCPPPLSPTTHTQTHMAHRTTYAYTSLPLKICKNEAFFHPWEVLQDMLCPQWFISFLRIYSCARHVTKKYALFYDLFEHLLSNIILYACRFLLSIFYFPK